MNILYHYYMGVKSILFVIPLVVFSFFIVSCSSEDEIKLGHKLYIVEEPQPKVFIVGEKSNIAWIDTTKSQRHQLNTIRALRDYEDELEEFEMESKFRRVVRSADGDTIFGYLKEVDNPGFEKVS